MLWVMGVCSAGDSVPFPTTPSLGERGEKTADEGGAVSEGGGEVVPEEAEDEEAKIAKELPHVVARVSYHCH